MVRITDSQLLYSLLWHLGICSGRTWWVWLLLTMTIHLRCSLPSCRYCTPYNYYKIANLFGFSHFFVTAHNDWILNISVSQRQPWIGEREVSNHSFEGFFGFDALINTKTSTILHQSKTINSMQFGQITTRRLCTNSFLKCGPITYWPHSFDKWRVWCIHMRYIESRNTRAYRNQNTSHREVDVDARAAASSRHKCNVIGSLDLIGALSRDNDKDAAYNLDEWRAWHWKAES